jgi:hypothetical protein
VLQVASHLQQNLKFPILVSRSITDFDKYLLDVAQAKFVVCPPGFGYDTHCIWESLVVGSIPVVEISPFGPGLERSFSHLPVLVVDDLLKV